MPGKPTTIRILTGLAAPTAGKVKVVGYDVVTERNKVTSEVGYCPEIPAFYNYMTATEWMHWVGKLYGLDKRTVEERTNELWSCAASARRGTARSAATAEG